MTSREYAKKLSAVVDLLEKAEEFTLPSYEDNYIENHGVVKLYYHNEKVPFIAAVRSLGSGTKGGDEQSLEFRHGDLVLVVYRSAVCRIIKPARPAEYECEPLLSPEEEAQIGAA